MKSCVDLFLVGLAGVVPVQAQIQAPPPASPDSAIERQVTTLVARTWGVPPDRVRLHWGPHRLHDLPAGSDVQLTGRGTHGWFAVVADPTHRGVVGQVRAGVLTPSPVALLPVAPGDTLTSESLHLETRLRWGAPDPTPATPGPGWIARRPVAPGDLVLPPSVVPPVVVRRGDPVRLVWARQRVEIEIEGRAEHAARSGERLRARVTGRTASVTGIVTGPGTARLLP